MMQATRIYDSYLGPEAPKLVEIPEEMLAFIQVRRPFVQVN